MLMMLRKKRIPFLNQFVDADKPQIIQYRFVLKIFYFRHLLLK